MAESLECVFKVGQFVPTKIIQIIQTDRGDEIVLSTKPNDINSEYTHKTVKKGVLLWAVVVEKSDHGYVADIGVPNVRAIIPFKFIVDSSTFGK